MVSRYLALGWPALDRACGGRVDGLGAALLAGGWRQVADATGLSLWTQGEALAVTATADLVVVGDVWDRSGSKPTLRTLAAFAEAGASPRRFTETFWGRYVAFFRTAERWTALRTPSGALPAFRWSTGAIGVLASHPEAAPTALAAPSQIDRDRLVLQLRAPDLAAAWPPLRGLSALSPGGCLDLQAGAPQPRPVWTPWTSIEEAPATREAAAERLRDAVLMACRAELGEGRALLELSGGFDSSVVAAALARTGQSRAVTAAVNFYSDRSDGDERAWAAEAAQVFGLPLRLAPKSVSALEARDFEELATGVLPALDTLDATRDRAVRALAAELEVSHVLTGQGGDAAFVQMADAALLREAMGGRGGGADPGRVLLDLARRHRTSVWTIAWQALLPHRRPFETFLTKDAMTQSSAPAHPWLEAGDSRRPARRDHIRAMLAMQTKFGPTRRAEVAEVRHPLLAQPVIEAALAAPGAWHLTGGRDRALARDAFAQDLPLRLADRRSKGAMSNLYARRLALSLSWLRPYLLEGWLATQGLLDRGKVSAVLTPEDLLWRARGLTLLRIAAVEAWARRWG